MPDTPMTSDDTRPAAAGDGQRAQGFSPLAVPADKQWNAGDRPVDWQGRVYGLVVHTTGSDLPAQAEKRGVHHTVRAVDHYSESHGCHYVNGWAGAAGGHLLQVANENEQAHGVGVTNPKEPAKDQRRSIEAGRFDADLPPVVVKLWRKRWPDHQHSLDLLPGTRTANSCYVHVECVPCVYHSPRGLVTGDGVEPMRPGLRFTRAQHDTVAALAVDVARRNGWRDASWWRTPRLLGHEDLTPISRHDKRGGWDPGYLREKPYFDWDHVYAEIERIVGEAGGAGTAAPAGGVSSLLDTLAEIGDRVSELITTGQEQLAVALARQRGIHDVNELTNLLFFARHPEMDGRPIASHETALAQEWIDIRDTIVGPALERPDPEAVP